MLDELLDVLDELMLDELELDNELELELLDELELDDELNEELELELELELLELPDELDELELTEELELLELTEELELELELELLELLDKLVELELDESTQKYKLKIYNCSGHVTKILSIGNPCQVSGILSINSKLRTSSAITLPIVSQIWYRLSLSGSLPTDTPHTN